MCVLQRSVCDMAQFSKLVLRLALQVEFLLIRERVVCSFVDRISNLFLPFSIVICFSIEPKWSEDTFPCNMIWALVDNRKVTFEMCLQPIRCWGANWPQEEAEYWGNTDAFMQKKCNELIYPTFRRNQKKVFLFLTCIKSCALWFEQLGFSDKEKRGKHMFSVIYGSWDWGKPSFTSFCVFFVLYELWLYLLIHNVAFYINWNAISIESIFLVVVFMRFTTFLTITSCRCDQQHCWQIKPFSFKLNYGRCQKGEYVYYTKFLWKSNFIHLRYLADVVGQITGAILWVCFDAYRETEDPVALLDYLETLGLDFQEPRYVSKEAGKKWWLILLTWVVLQVVLLFRVLLHRINPLPNVSIDWESDKLF